MGKGREFVDKNDAQIQKYLDKSVGKLHFYQDMLEAKAKMAFLAKFRQLSRSAAIFIEKSIIFNKFYVEISIILGYIYVEKSIIFG
jgi:hypothetical protein